MPAAPKNAAPLPGGLEKAEYFERSLWFEVGFLEGSCFAGGAPNFSESVAASSFRSFSARCLRGGVFC